MANKITKVKKLYRWYDDFNFDTLIHNIKWEGYECYNYTNSFEFAKEHWNIVVEFDVVKETLNIMEEVWSRKQDNPHSYDALILKNNIDGFRWFVTEWKFYNCHWNVYHYRVKKDLLKVHRIYYISDNLKSNIANITAINRKYKWYNQQKFSSLLWVYRTKISEYENQQRLPNIDMISKIASFLPFPQQMVMNNSKIVFE